MRFIKEGPSIPDDLLIARDEGRVIFFCGAGVSRACAGLPDFLGLVENVICNLGVPIESPVCKILNEARQIGQRTGVSGLISVDRIFGLLERDFLSRDIEIEVAKSLSPPVEKDLSAHQTLLELSKTPEGKIRLVTTNFDRLFEDCSSGVKIWHPPKLPDPSLHREMDGIIHLHGCVNDEYTGAIGDGFILSSSDFGSAYLSDGWATQFFREIISRYFVVFVGYTADDPPVQYLLEALNKKSGRLDGVYAFQSGLAEEAAGKWRHKGVEAIPYDDKRNHRALWESLTAWAERAKAPNNWYKSVIDLANQGPENLEPHQRGQVAHIISTVEGARKISESNNPPPAEWLFVFDPNQRFATPGHTGHLGEGPIVDPFELYGLDSDFVPKKINPEDPFEKREIPATAWDGLAANRRDLQNLKNSNFSSVRGGPAISMPRLPSRLSAIGTWIMKVADQPAAVWWAAGQYGIHPEIQDSIQWQLERSQNVTGTFTSKAWRYLFEAWSNLSKDFRRDLYELSATIKKDGWSLAIVRRFADIAKPYLKAGRNEWQGPKPPQCDKESGVEDILNLKIEYPILIEDLTIPDEWLFQTIRELRKCLEHGILLETELNSYALKSICPIIPDSKGYDDGYERTHGLSGYVVWFAELFENLTKFEIAKAKQELETWPINDNSVFDRLMIWASGNENLVSAQSFGKFIANLSNEAFWDRYHQRDLLVVLAKRWNSLPNRTRLEIESRIFKGREKWEYETYEEFKEYNAWSILNRLHWLNSQNCKLKLNLQEVTKELQDLSPKWKLRSAENAADSLEGRGGWVKTETEHSALLNTPIPNILTKAIELSGETENFLIHTDPFAGLCADKPVRAFSTLTCAAKHNDYPEWAWRTFLNSKTRENDNPKFIALIAERIIRYPEIAVANFISPAASWIKDISKSLSNSYPNLFDSLISKLTCVLKKQAGIGESSIKRGNKKPDWVMEAINAPVGKIAESLFKDPRKDNLKKEGGFPDCWINHVEELLSLDGNLRCHALTIFAFNLSWFFNIDSAWTESNLLSVIDNIDEPDGLAAWSGFLWAAKIPGPALFKRLKTKLLIINNNRNLTHRGYGKVLAGIILAGWGSIDSEADERYISNYEMRRVLLNSDDEFRSHTLWQLKIWSENGKDANGSNWADLLIEFLQDVWPRQKAVKTPSMSSQLCGLAFSNKEKFVELSEIILPLLTTTDGRELSLPRLTDAKDTIFDLYPQHALALLSAVLPNTVENWSYDIESILQRIGEADDSLRLDERLLELKRKWNAR